MKHYFIFTVMLSFFAYQVIAQTSLPYYTGFDNSSEKAGWQEFSTGNTTAYQWIMGANIYYRSAPNILLSPSTEFATLADTAIEWFVSPGFHMTSGGKIDSFAINVFQPNSNPLPSDSIVLYVLQGSNNPSLATQKVRLANLTGMAKSDYVFHDTGNFIIPPFSGTTYIAFKFYSVFDWFQCMIDNVNISSNTTSITEIEENNLIFIYPIPSIDKINVCFSNSIVGNVEIKIINALGQTLLYQTQAYTSTKPLSIDISNLTYGIYTIFIITDKNKKYFKKFVVL